MDMGLETWILEYGYAAMDMCFEIWSVTYGYGTVDMDYGKMMEK